MDDGDSSGDEIDVSMMDTGPHSGDKRAGSSNRGKRNQNKGKTKVEYEASIKALASVWVAKCDRAVTFE